MNIHFLHPYFTIVIVILLIISYRNFNLGSYIKTKGVWIIIIFLIILAGFRTFAPDDAAYNSIYEDAGSSLPFSYSKLKENIYGMEWLYILSGKISFLFGFPFYIFIIFFAIITISIKYRFYENNSAYPVLSFLIYMFPSYFNADMTHIRQAMAIAIVFVSYWAIKKRNLPIFLIIIYIAKGFHTSAIIFLFAYWIAVIPVKKWMIAVAVGLCIILSPFEVYNNISLLDGIAPSEVMEGFNGYNDMVEEDTGKIHFMDLLSFFYLYFILAFNKEAEKKIPYYEYMRNLTVFGICIYFIFRDSPIFSTRLVSYYFLFASVTIPSILAAVPSINLKRYLHFILLLFIIFYYFTFAALGGRRVASPTIYSNWLIGG